MRSGARNGKVMSKIKAATEGEEQAEEQGEREKTGRGGPRRGAAPVEEVGRENGGVVYRTKTQALSARLGDMARELGPSARLPTMTELSKQLGVSMMTLNRALSELEAQGIIYRRQGSGTYVSPSTGPTARSVGLVYDRDIFDSGQSPFCGLLVDEARRRAQSGDERFSLYLAVPSREGLPVHDDLLRSIEKKRVDGLLLVCEAQSPAVKWLVEQSLPIVALSYLPVVPHRVAIDWAAVAREGVRELAAQGCRDIGLWLPLGVGLGRARGEVSFPELDAFRLALQDAELPYKSSRVWRLDELEAEAGAMTDSTNQEQGFRAAFETFEGKAGDAPDGLVILDDMMTRGALVVLEQKGVLVNSGQTSGKAKAKGGVRIATHSNRGSSVLRAYEEQLTRLEIDPAAVAGAMFSMLEDMIDGRETESPVRIGPNVLPPQS
jgi:DNA-binding LacI/PurR family transcriptional regulator